MKNHLTKYGVAAAAVASCLVVGMLACKPKPDTAAVIKDEALTVGRTAESLPAADE